jgi:hypothetical protein
MRVYPKPYVENVPGRLAAASPPPSDAELAAALEFRVRFLLDGEPMPYMVDITRAMRLVRGCRRYIEVGTFDKGNLAYVSSLLAPNATLIDVDLQAHPDRTDHLRSVVQPSQRLVTVTGDSTSPDALGQVREALGGAGADAVFIDGDHTAPFAWADYANFLRLTVPGGVMMFHDIFYRGDDHYYGVVQAMEWIDRLHPVWVVFETHPIHRFFPWLVKSEVQWGGVGIVLA